MHEAKWMIAQARIVMALM